MMSLSAFEKRVRRRISGREQDFFVVVSPGLEKICCREFLTLPINAKDVSESKGGISFRARVQDCYAANLYLRCASRILMRIAAFKSTNFRQFEKRILGIEWELYLPVDRIPKVHVSSKKSRLFHTTAVQSIVQKSIQDQLSGGDSGQPYPDRKDILPDIYVRIVDDMVTVSIDSSGMLLYKRGLKTHRAKAPVRETIAAAALILAGYDGTGCLVDPMCGSGTFALEAAMISNRIPAGWYRRFAFESWPCFRPGMWQYIRKQAQENILVTDQAHIFSSDTDATACRDLTESLAGLDFQNRISVSCRNFFDLTPSDFTAGISGTAPGLVANNPPYGMRIGKKMESGKQFRDALNKLVQDFPGWQIALIVPREMVQAGLPLHLDIHPVAHGGVDLVIAVGRVP